MGVFEEKMSVFKPLTPESLARILAAGGRRSAGGSGRSDKQKTSANRSRSASAENSRKGSTIRSPKLGDGNGNGGGGDAQTKALVCADHVCIKKKQQEPKPNASLAAGKKLPPAFGDYFPKKLYGVPIEDIDPFYSDKKVCARGSC